jgi:hypothetical protein
VRVVGGVLGETTRVTERAVNFVGRDVEETETLAGGAGEVFEVGAGGLEEG